MPVKSFMSVLELDDQFRWTRHPIKLKLNCGNQTMLWSCQFNVQTTNILLLQKPFEHNSQEFQCLLLNMQMVL